MHTLVFDRRDISLEYENQCLIVRQPDTLPRSIPLTHIRRVLCLHSVRLTTSLLGQFWQRGIDFVAINSRYSERSFALHPNQQQQVARRCLQYRWQQDEQLCLELARTLCQHRLRNNQRIFRSRKMFQLNSRLEQAHSALQQAQSLDQLRGIEGAMQREVFACWRSKISSDLEFKERIRRPPTDPVNALLSLTYTIAMSEAIKQCTAKGLDTQLGFYHRTAFGRHSLACDLMEPLRPACEAWVMDCFINGLLNRRNFSGMGTPQSPCLLGKSGREIYYKAIAEVLPTWQRQLRATALWLARIVDRRILTHGGSSHAEAALVPDSI